MKKTNRIGAVIAEIFEDSIASKIGLNIGDKIYGINGKEVRDLIEFSWLWSDEELDLAIETKDGLEKTIHVSKEIDETIGAVFEKPLFDCINVCRNKCLFCFVDQMKKGMRPTLYIKDDDYRLSFLQSSFVTLTNLTDKDIDRIIEQKLSPLYISVHATDKAVRSKLLGRDEEDFLLEYLKKLSDGGIEFHTQVVLCPGINDGTILEKTYNDLINLPGCLDLAVVPVGLTQFRENLPHVSTVTKDQAKRLIMWLRTKQKTSLDKRNTRFIWLSDEFYVLAEEKMPEPDTYEGYPQYENGIGLIASFLEEADWIDMPNATKPKTINLSGGISAMKALSPLWDKLSKVEGVTLNLLPLENTFFGPTVNVSGLLTGSCLIDGLTKYKDKGIIKNNDVIYLPSIMIRDKGDAFIDGMTVDEVSKELSLELVFLPQSGDTALEIILGETND